MHVGRHNDPRLPFVSLSGHGSELIEKNGFSQCFRFLTDDSGATDLAVENHYIVRVRCEPGLHGFTDSTNPVQGWGVKVRPAIVLHLKRRGGETFSILGFTWVKPSAWPSNKKAVMFWIIFGSQLSFCVQSSVWSASLQAYVTDTFGLSLVMSCLFSDKFSSCKKRTHKKMSQIYFYTATEY